MFFDRNRSVCHDYIHISLFKRLARNPTLEFNPSAPAPLRARLGLAINTAQVGRTFQDRSHVFFIEPRDPAIPQGRNVVYIGTRGKRGNIVQNYPAVEYDFVPNTVRLMEDDVVIYQTGGKILSLRISSLSALFVWACTIFFLVFHWPLIGSTYNQGCV